MNDHLRVTHVVMVCLYVHYKIGSITRCEVFGKYRYLVFSINSCTCDEWRKHGNEMINKGVKYSLNTGYLVLKR